MYARSMLTYKEYPLLFITRLSKLNKKNNATEMYAFFFYSFTLIVSAFSTFFMINQQTWNLIQSFRLCFHPRLLIEQVSKLSPGVWYIYWNAECEYLNKDFNRSRQRCDPSICGIHCKPIGVFGLTVQNSSCVNHPCWGRQKDKCTCYASWRIHIY